MSQSTVWLVSVVIFFTTLMGCTEEDNLSVTGLSRQPICTEGDRTNKLAAVGHIYVK